MTCYVAGKNKRAGMQVFEFEPVQGRAERGGPRASNTAANRLRLKSRSAVAAYKGAMMAVEY